MDEESLTFDSRTDAPLVERLRTRFLDTRRRRVALLLAVVGAALVTAVAVGALPGAGDDRAPVDRVPAGANAVVVADASAAERTTTRTLVEGITTRLHESDRYAGPTGYRPLLRRANSETSAPLEAVETTVGYGRIPENGTAPYGAIIVVADWDAPTAVGAVERAVNRSPLRNASFVQKEVATGTVYRPSTNLSLRIGVLDDGYAVGTPTAVRHALAVDRGDRAALGGPLRSAYDSTRDGAIRYAAAVPNGSLSTGADRYGIDAIPEPEHVSGATVAANGTVEVTARIHASTADDAHDLEDLIRARDILLKTTDPEVDAALDNLTVDRTDTRVTVTYAAPADTAGAHAVGVVDRGAVRTIARLARSS